MTVYINGVAQVDGGYYGINVETLGADKTLTPGVDQMYQYLDEGGADKIITLATAGATAGDRFIIRHNGDASDAHSLEVKQAAVTLDKIWVGAIKGFVFDGTNWVPFTSGTGEDDSKKFTVTIGHQADSHEYGVAVGFLADSHDHGTAIGRSAVGHTYGTGLGFQADGSGYGVAVGYCAITNSKKYSIALGYRSETERVGETSVNINGDDSDQENNVVQGRWEGAAANDTPLEIFCAGQANERFLIRVNSVLAFRMTIVARDNVAGHAAMWTVVDGLIKRDGAGNTTMVTCTVVEVADESTDWAVAVTADDTNESLKIEVTGDPDNPTQFAAVLEGVETHFGA